MTKPTPTAGRAVDELLSRLVAQLHSAIAARLAWRAAAFLVAVAWSALVLDRLIEPGPSVRLAVEIGLAIVALVWIVCAAAPRLLRTIREREVVALLHREHPRESLLIATSLDLRGGDSTEHPALAADTIEAADRAAESLRRARLVRPAGDSGVVWFAATALTGVIGLALAQPAAWATLARRLALSDTPWPRRVELVAEGFQYDPVAGEWIRYAVRGEPAEVELLARVAAEEQPPATAWARGGVGTTRRLGTLTRVGGVVRDRGATQRFRRRVERLDDDLRLAIRVGDASLRLRLIAAARPRLSDIEIHSIPPEYLRQRPTIAVPTTLEPLPEGSRVEVVARSATRLANVVATRIRDAAGADPIAVGLHHEGSLVRATLGRVDRSAMIRLTATDARGLESEPIELAIEVAPDSPPVVSLSLAGVARAVTRDARAPVLVRVDDDDRVETALLRIQAGEAQVDLPLPRPIESPAELAGEVDLLSLRSSGGAARLAFEPGDRFSLVALASDRFDLAPREPSSSAPVELEVITPAELLARLGDAQRELRVVVESLRSDADRLAYELDLGRRRLAEARDDQTLGRWADDRALDARKAAAGVREAARRASGLRSQVVNNRLDQPALEDRLDGAVIRPLRQVAERDLPGCETALARLRTDPAEAVLADAIDSAKRAAATLSGVAASLDSQQTYNEVVALLRGLIREQRRVNQQTTRREADSARSLFD